VHTFSARSGYAQADVLEYIGENATAPFTTPLDPEIYAILEMIPDSFVVERNRLVVEWRLRAEGVGEDTAQGDWAIWGAVEAWGGKIALSHGFFLS